MTQHNEEHQQNGIRRLLKVDDVAALLSMSPSYVYKAARRGALPGAVYIGSALRFDSEALERWLKDRAQSSVPTGALVAAERQGEQA
jgi:excisionase family DNA binding protein